MTIRQLASTLVLAVLLAAPTGCVRHRVIAPPVALGTTSMTGLTEADYEDLGETEGESSGGTVLGLFPYGDREWSPSDPDRAAPHAVGGRCMRAVLNALAKFDKADALVYPRLVHSSYNFVLWSSWYVKAAGRAIRITKTEQPVQDGPFQEK